MEYFIIAVASLAVPILIGVVLIRDGNRHYKNGYEDGYNDELYPNRRSHGRPMGIHPQSKYNSGYIDGQREAKRKKQQSQEIK